MKKKTLNCPETSVVVESSGTANEGVERLESKRCSTSNDVCIGRNRSCFPHEVFKNTQKHSLRLPCGSITTRYVASVDSCVVRAYRSKNQSKFLY